ncbi:MAG TPA: hypothetical protein VE964_06755 [Myxococcales bacterium]|nr:hypothetical protein [Myxococcales bacterium]
MTRRLLAAALACVSAAASACPLCLGAGQQTKAQQLVAARQAVLAVPTADASCFRIIEVIKGERPSSGTIEGGHPRFGPASDAAAPKRGKPLLLLRDDPLPTWAIVGAIGADHSSWLRKLAAGKRTAEMSAEEWRARVALVVPYLEDREPLAAEIAYGELAAAPYAAMRTAKPRLDAPAIRGWLTDPKLAARQPLYLLLLGVAGNAQDAAALEQRLEAAWKSGDATNLGSMLAADLELRGAARMAWVEARYLRDRARSAPEIRAALLALSVHGNANGVIPRVRVIQSYRVFMKEHQEIAGYVAQDLAAWQYWDAAPEYVALMKSNVPQQYPSRVAIVAYLRQSPSAEARDFAQQTGAEPARRR